ncbi:MAG TPA: GNAT family N-acetyltransferase [Bacteroidia bacterium]
MNNTEAFPTLETERLILRAITNDDCQAMFDLRSNPKLMKYIPRPLCVTLKDAETLLGKVIMANENRTNINWAMSLKDNPHMFGFMGFAKVHAEDHRAEVGYMMLESHFGYGYMREALKAVIDYGFDVMNMHTLQGIIDPENTASENILIHHGFVKEAHFKENVFFEGQYLDSVHYTLFRDTWASRKI